MNIKVPCTSANLGVLFDKGGVALDGFCNEITVLESERFSVSVKGIGERVLPLDESNLVCSAISRYFDETGFERVIYTIEMINEIPLSRGLGSSAACIAGGMYAANVLAGSPLSNTDIIHMAARMEGHGDNVCPAVLGGFTIYDKNKITSPGYSDEIAFILYIPGTELSTTTSRGVLPKEYDVNTLKKAASLGKEMIEALEASDYEKAGSLMGRDVIHQPYRKQFIPYWDAVTETAGKAGAFGTALSGAGPSMISMCPADKCETILNNVANTIDNKYGLSIMKCEICKTGLTMV